MSTATEEDLTARLAEKLGSSAHASAVFGAPVKQATITVIPVAKSRYGFGAGSGDEGSGGGGGVAVSPVGWIEISDDGSRFRPLRPRGIVAAVLVLLALTAAGAGLLGRRSQPRQRRRFRIA